MAVHDLQVATFLGANHIDLMLYRYGHAICRPGEGVGPTRCEHHLFCYAVSGKGTLIATDDGVRRRFDLVAGEGFLVFPGQMAAYFAAGDEPWEYRWVEFDGVSAKRAIEGCGLTTSAPIYRSRDIEARGALECELRYLVDNRDSSELDLIAHGYLFLDKLARSIEPAPATDAVRPRNPHVTKAIAYIEDNYQHDISIEDVARQAGLSRGHFNKVFRDVTGTSPQQHLIELRMGKAAELLASSTLSVGAVGRAVGYRDQLQFSRAFKKAHGVSPTAWRRGVRAADAGVPL